MSETPLSSDSENLHQYDNILKNEGEGNQYIQTSGVLSPAMLSMKFCCDKRQVYFLAALHTLHLFFKRMWNLLLLWKADNIVMKYCQKVGTEMYGCWA